MVWPAPVTRLALAGAALGLVAGCAREDEAGMRARLAQWFALGETVAFAARGDCAAGVFRLRGDAIGAALEARECMDADTRAGFHAGLTAQGAMLAHDRESGTVMVIDRDAGRIFALMGAR